ncbi:hypothetical protein [Streptomyces sp. JJ36]|uniref:Rv1733c family protein n=1 Tax=Streptomyces sp. JJ36 TaxID=2736645 RepID=UPI001F21F1B7|nr:hypothetical protein [Streptomyces sp. JJ36]MCF6524868.1 hypothetical protein [Streptomyces sp. JJ36]
MGTAQPPPAAPPPGVPGSSPTPAGHNPLRRPCDRAQSRVNVLLVLVLLLGGVWAAFAAGTAAHDAHLEQARTQAAERTEVTARLTTDGKEATGADPGRGADVAQVRWTDEDGTVHTGTVRVEAGAERGDPARVWVDREGHLTTPPDSPASAAMSGWVTALLVAGGAVIAVMLLRAVLARLFDRHRYALWEEEWARLEPRWSGRARG